MFPFSDVVGFEYNYYDSYQIIQEERIHQDWCMIYHKIKNSV